MYNDMPEDTATYIVQIEDHEFMDEAEGTFGVYLCYYTNADVWGFNSDTLGDVERHGVFDDLDEAKDVAKKLSLKNEGCEIWLFVDEYKEVFKLSENFNITITIKVFDTEDNDRYIKTCNNSSLQDSTVASIMDDIADETYEIEGGV